MRAVEEMSPSKHPDNTICAACGDELSKQAVPCAYLDSTATARWGTSSSALDDAQDETINDARIKAEDDGFAVNPAPRDEAAIVDLTEAEAMETEAQQHKELHSFEINPVKVGA